MTSFANSTSATVLALSGLLAGCIGGADDAEPRVDLADLEATLAHGQGLYQQTGQCADCHGGFADGGDGPDLRFGPSAYDIHYQLNTNPEMAESRDLLQPTHEDIVAIAAYVHSLADREVNATLIEDLVASMQSARDYPQSDPSEFLFGERDVAISEFERFETVLANWERRAETGSIRRDYQVRVARTYEPGEQKFTPEPGRVYFYENTGAGQPPEFGYPNPEDQTAGSTQIVVGDAATKEVIAWNRFPPTMRAAVHTTAVSPDGRYVYITGPRPALGSGEDRSVAGLDTPATIIKADALTLEPIEQLVVGGRLHHAQIFQNRLMLVDTFARDANGLDVFLMDPETNEIMGGVRDEELGGGSYTAYTDNQFIYILMEPEGYGPGATGGYRAAGLYNRGEYATIRPFWVAKVDPETWEVVQEYPYPGFRANWIVIDSAQENMYVAVGANSFVSKINLETGEIVWTTPTGTGPYGASLNADETQLWVADKGETTGMFGRTMTVIDTVRGRQVDTLFSGYQVDHVLLSPNGREMWGTSNAEGKIYVFDAASREKTHEIVMPGFGDAHGLVFVWYDDDLTPHVVRDQGGFHAGVNPVLGQPLDY